MTDCCRSTIAMVIAAAIAASVNHCNSKRYRCFVRHSMAFYGVLNLPTSSTFRKSWRIVSVLPCMMECLVQEAPVGSRVTSRFRLRQSIKGAWLQQGTANIFHLTLNHATVSRQLPSSLSLGQLRLFPSLHQNACVLKLLLLTPE